MSLRLIPEALASSPPPAIDRPASQRPDTRPIEQSGKSGQSGANGTGSQGQPSGSNSFAAVRAAMSPRPPGIDPSVLPQSLFDASLISATFKPSLNLADLQQQAEDTAEDEAGGAGQSTSGSVSDSEDDALNALAAAHGNAAEGSDGAHQIEAGKIEAYSRGSGGSPLSPASAANPDWLSAVEHIA